MTKSIEGVGRESDPEADFQNLDKSTGRKPRKKRFRGVDIEEEGFGSGEETETKSLESDQSSASAPTQSEADAFTNKPFAGLELPKPIDKRAAQLHANILRNHNIEDETVPVKKEVCLPKANPLPVRSEGLQIDLNDIPGSVPSIKDVLQGKAPVEIDGIEKWAPSNQARNGVRKQIQQTPEEVKPAPKETHPPAQDIQPEIQQNQASSESLSLSELHDVLGTMNSNTELNTFLRQHGGMKGL